MWMSGGAWLCRHLWEHYPYTGDKEFLREVYPIVKGGRVFRRYDGLRTGSGMAGRQPEQFARKFLMPTTVLLRPPVARWTTQPVAELWNNIIAATEVLRLRSRVCRAFVETGAELPPMQVGHWGQLQEWMYDWDNPDDKHRHVSHLYGLYPSNQIFRSARPNCSMRREHRSFIAVTLRPAGAWGWKVCLLGAMLDGDHAYKLITDQLTLVHQGEKQGGTYPNLSMRIRLPD